MRILDDLRELGFDEIINQSSLTFVLLTARKVVCPMTGSTIKFIPDVGIWNVSPRPGEPNYCTARCHLEGTVADVQAMSTQFVALKRDGTVVKWVSDGYFDGKLRG